MSRAPLTVALEDGRYSVEAAVDRAEAERIVFSLKGGPVTRGLRVRRTEKAHMRRADREAPVGFRNEPYYVLCDPDERYAMACWVVDVDASKATIDELLAAILRFGNGDLLVPEAPNDLSDESPDVIVPTGTDSHAQWKRLFAGRGFVPPPVPAEREQALRDIIPMKEVSPPE